MISRLFTLLIAFAVFAGEFISHGQNAPEQDRPPFPQLKLTRYGLRHEEAIVALGNDLASVAVHYRKSPDELRSLFRRDKDARLDKDGRIMFVCDGLVAPVVSSQTNVSDIPVSALQPLDQTFLLHSKTGSTKVIFLDFDGHTLSGNQWTASYNGGSNIVALPWDIDGNPAVFGDSERIAIQQIWLRVAEDYAPYDVDVTTEFPGEAAMTRANNSDQVYGTRALISPIGSYFGNPGGIAYLGVFDNTGNNNKPALIFPENLANFEKYIAEAISHEVGHNLGLSHDGVTGGDPYYTGQGNWAPIMGVGYYKPISHWSRGEYANANNLENDLVVMTQNGLSYRTDDFGSTIATAKAITGLSIATNGIIGRTNDVDFFSVQSGAGTAQITVTPWELGANLHLSVSLYDSAGVIITNREVSDNSSSGVQSVTFSATVAAGANYFSIDGTGAGVPNTTGYSDYGSQGNYKLLITLPPPWQWLPTAGGSYSWTNTVNWVSGAIPNSANSIARLNNNIAGAQTISLNAPITLGQLIIGDTNGTHGFTIQNGSGGSMLFDVTSGSATILKTSGANDVISASLVLLDNLVVSNSTSARLTLSGSIAGNHSFTKQGSGGVALSGTNTYSGNTDVSAGTLALELGVVLTNTPLITLTSGATLDAGASGFVLESTQQLRGNGVVVGNFIVSGVLSPGTSIGVLTFSNNLSMGMTATTWMEISNATMTNDLLQVSGALAYDGTLIVTNLGGTLTAGDSFKLFDASNYSGNFTTNTLPLLNVGLGWVFTPTNGTLSVVMTIATNSTNITALVAGNALELSWPSDHIGWRLEAQTNSLADGLGTNWFNVTGSSATNRMSLPIDVENGCVLFRLIYP